MIQKVEELLRELQNLTSTLRLYPPDHPRVSEGVARTEKMAADLTRDERSLTVSCVGNKVIWNDEPIPGGMYLSRALFAALKRYGYDRFTFLPGMTAEELASFLGALSAAAATEGGKSRLDSASFKHIRLATIDAQSLEPPIDASRELLDAQVETLKSVWSRVMEEQELDLDTLEGILMALSRIVQENLGALMPFAELKAHDEYTATHITNVALLAMGLAEAVGLSADRVREIGIAALLHDVGKLRVPIEILNKPDRLTEAQQAAIRRHPEEGARLLYATAGVPELAVAVAYEHHVRFDGGGYPLVPRGWRTTLASAITQVTDIYDALRTDRPYREGYPHARIEHMMRADSGSLFDPKLLDVFFNLVVPSGEEGAPARE